jgi:tetraacyldisaccharide 4'-kinase
VGGSGKTILTRDILGRLPGMPFALTRGYGGRLRGPLLVDPSLHGPADVGDEALLLAATAPTILARDRAAGARLALSSGGTAIVMDDGLQNPSLKKSRSFLVVDGGYGFGNGLLLPAGPLREPVAAAAARCAAAVLIGDDTVNSLGKLPAGLPVLRAKLKPECATNLVGIPVIAFAGIGRPQKFFDSVRELGANLIAKIEFPDHHNYSNKDLERLRSQASTWNAQLITTEKDFVKLSSELRRTILVVTIRLEWQAGLSQLMAIDTQT